MCWKSRKRVVEGAARAPASPPYSTIADLFAGRKVGVVLSGGNIDMRLLSNVILRELTREGRISQPGRGDRRPPGALARVATLVGEAGGNILEVSHNRMMSGMSAKSAELGHGDRSARRRACGRKSARPWTAAVFR